MIGQAAESVVVTLVVVAETSQPVLVSKQVVDVQVVDGAPFVDVTLQYSTHAEAVLVVSQDEDEDSWLQSPFGQPPVPQFPVAQPPPPHMLSGQLPPQNNPRT